MGTVFYMISFLSLFVCNPFVSDEVKSIYKNENSQQELKEVCLLNEQQALLQNEAYKNPIVVTPLEKELIANLKSPDQENMRGGYVKFRVTLLLSDKNVVKEVDAKSDIVRDIITNSASAYLAGELQSAQGRQKVANSIVTNINSMLTDGKVAAVVFPDFISWNYYKDYDLMCKG